MRPLILVTGFGPFLGQAVNPAEPLAQQIEKVDHPTHDFVSLTPLPAELGTAAELARKTAHGRHAVAILALGLLPTTTKIRIEAMARNRVDAIVPGGTAIGTVPILESAPESFRTPLDLGAIARTLESTGIPWEASDDAGTYVCNDLYFRLLEAHARDAAPPAAFVHVPDDAHEIPRLAEALAEGMVHALLALAKPSPG